jgi:hypothetical protein
MRALVLVLALLATLKVWVQDNAYRSATEEALLSAYRVRAADACAHATPSDGLSSRAATALDWTTEAEPRLTIGNPALPVRVWEFDSELWNARFRQPYLVLSLGDTGRTCSYDILAGTAAIARS